MKRTRDCFPMFDTKLIGQTLKEIRVKRAHESVENLAPMYNCHVNTLYAIENGNFSPYNSVVFMRYAYHMYTAYTSAMDVDRIYQDASFKSNALDLSHIDVEGYIELYRCINTLFGSLNTRWMGLSAKAREYKGARMCSDKEFGAFAKSCRESAGENGPSAAEIIYCTQSLISRFENNGCPHPERSAAIMRYIFTFVVPDMVASYSYAPSKLREEYAERYAPYVNYILKKVLTEPPVSNEDRHEGGKTKDAFSIISKNVGKELVAFRKKYRYGTTRVAKRLGCGSSQIIYIESGKTNFMNSGLALRYIFWAYDQLSASEELSSTYHPQIGIIDCRSEYPYICSIVDAINAGCGPAQIIKRCETSTGDFDD